MGVLADIEDRFEDLKGSSELEEAFRGWAPRRHVLMQFDGPEEMIAFLREQKGTYDDRNKVIWAICIEARKEAAKKNREGKSRPTAGRKRRERGVASDLLVGLFIPALWRVFDEANRPDLLDPKEIEGEILLGFWEAVRTRKNGRKLSGALMNAGRKRVWTALERAAKEQQLLVPFDEDHLGDEEQDSSVLQPEWSDPWVVVCWAQHNEVVDEVEAELIFWTRLHDRPLKKIAPVFDLTYEAARYRRSQAERRLRDWLAESTAELPPNDPDTAAQVLALAHKPPPPELARVNARVSVTRAENRLTRADFAPVCLTKEG